MNIQEYLFVISIIVSIFIGMKCRSKCCGKDCSFEIEKETNTESNETLRTITIGRKSKINKSFKQPEGTI